MDSDKKENVLDLLINKFKDQDDKNSLEYIKKEYAEKNGIPIYKHSDVITLVNKEYGKGELCNRINKFK